MPGVFEWLWPDATARNAEVVSQLQIGLKGRVLSGSGAIYTAIAAGSGTACWSDGAADTVQIEADIVALQDEDTALDGRLDTAETTLDDHEDRIVVLEGGP